MVWRLMAPVARYLVLESDPDRVTFLGPPGPLPFDFFLGDSRASTIAFVARSSARPRVRWGRRPNGAPMVT